MKTEKELTERIMAVTLEIEENYPELSKYIIEMTVTNPDEKNPEVNRKKLEDYYNSLIEMVKKYKQNHAIQETENQKKENVFND